MSAMALGFEAFQTDSACDLSMTDRKRSYSWRLSCRRVRISLEKGWFETSRNSAGQDGRRSRNGREVYRWPEERLMKS